MVIFVFLAMTASLPMTLALTSQPIDSAMESDSTAKILSSPMSLKGKWEIYSDSQKCYYQSPTAIFDFTSLINGTNDALNPDFSNKTTS